MAVSQSISDLEYQAYLAANPGSKLSLADFKYKQLGGPQVGKSITDLEYASLPATTPPPGSLADRQFKSYGGPTVPPKSLADLKYAAGGGSGVFDPKTIPNIAGWYDFSDASTVFSDTAGTVPITVDGTGIACIKDKSGLNATPFTQATVSQRPAWRNAANGISGLACAAPDGNDYLDSPQVNNQPCSIFIVASATTYVSGTGSATLMDGAGGRRIMCVDTASKTFTLYSGSYLFDSAVAPFGTNVYAGIFNGAASAIRLNKTQRATGDVGAQNLTIIRLMGDTSPQNFWPAGSRFCEVLMYSRVLTAAEINAVENYLSTKWVIGSLPSISGFNPLSLIPWHSAFWAEDPAWSHPADGVAVPSWRDGSGNARDLTQATGSLQPLYKAVTPSLNNRPAVQFDGVDDYLAGPVFTGLPTVPGYSFVVVMQRRGPGGGGSERIIRQFTAGTPPQMWMTTTTWTALGSAQLNSTVPVDTNGHLLAAVFAVGVNGPIIVDGTSTSGTLSIGGPLTQVAIGWPQVPNESPNMYVAFAAVYPGDITAHANWLALKTGLATMYGLTVA